MASKLKKRFEAQVQRVADLAQDMINRGEENRWWGSTYVEGVSAALDWVLGGMDPGENPLHPSPTLVLRNRVGRADLEQALKTVISALAESQAGDGTTLARLAANKAWFKHVCEMVGLKPEDFNIPKAV